MGKVRKFATSNIRQLQGGRDPFRLVEEFITRRGFDPEECRRDSDGDNARWMLAISESEDLEVLIENAKRPQETTIYLGLNVVTVPIRGVTDVLAAALEIADGLVGIKISLVGHFLVLSASLAAAGLTEDDLDFHYKLITAQHPWFKAALAEELGWEEVPQT